MAAENIVKYMSEADENWFIQNARYKFECDRNTLIHNAEKRGREEGLQVGIQQGIQQGEQKKAEETAITMLNDNLEIDKVVLYSGLPRDQVLKLQKQIKPVVPQA